MKNLSFFLILFLSVSLISCQKDDAEGEPTGEFILKTDSKGIISSPKWLAQKVDSVAHAYPGMVSYPSVIKISTSTDYYIFVEAGWASSSQGMYFTKSGKQILSDNPLLDVIKVSTNREVIWKYGEMSLQTRTSTLTPAYVYTPQGSLVSDTYYVSESLSPSQIASLNNQVATAYPNAVIISDATSTYNCHAYAWYMTEGGSAVWMGTQTNPTAIYWTDGSYMSATMSSASKISYLSDNHSAVATGTSNTFISKWGQGPLVRHVKDDCPYDASELIYLKIDDRPSIYIGQTDADYSGCGPTLYSSSAHTEFTLYAYSPKTTVNRYVWSANFNGIYDRWYSYPNSSYMNLSMYFNNIGDGGRLDVTCTMYNGSTLVGTATYYMVVVYS